MHSSRMRTVRSSSRLSRAGGGVSAPGWGVSAPGRSAPGVGGVRYNLRNFVADGNNTSSFQNFNPQPQVILWIHLKK